MNEEYSNKEDEESEDNAIGKMNTYEKAIRVISKSIVSFMNENGAPPPADVLYGTVSKIGKKINKSPEEVIVDVKKYMEKMDSDEFGGEPDITDGSSSYEQFIHDYSQAMYKSLLSHLSSMKDIPSEPFSAEIPEKHVDAISKKFNKKPNKVMHDIYGELEKIQLYKGINETS